MISANRKIKGYEVIMPFIIGLLLPPFFSVIYLFFLTYKHRSDKLGIAFIFFFVLFLTYNFFSIDNIGRVHIANEKIYDNSILTIDALSLLIHHGINKTSLESCHFLFFYIFTNYVFLLKTITKSTDRKLDITLLIIFITTMSLRNAMDLLYYSLATTFTLWFISNKKYTIVNLIILTTIAYLMHPGVLMLFFPSIALYYSMKLSIKGGKHIYIIMLALIFIFAFTLSATTSFLATGIPAIDAMLDKYNSYTSDFGWGKRSGSRSITGITYTILYYIIPFIYFVIFFYSVKYYKKIKNKKILCFFQTSMLFYPNFINFVTISERNLLVLSITSIIVFIMMTDIQDKKPKFITINSLLALCLLIASFNLYKLNEAVKLSNVFETGTYEEIRDRSYYIPSFILLDYGDFGYSDEFVKANTNITF